LGGGGVKILVLPLKGTIDVNTEMSAPPRGL